MWVVVVLASCAAAACGYRFLRGLRSRYPRVLLPAAWIGLTLMPAPVPGYAGNLAPAFVVFAFEALFQADGAPWVAGRLALAGVAVGVATALLGLLVWQRRVGSVRPKPANEADAAVPTSASAISASTIKED